MKVVILLGGLIGVDGYASSGGMIDLGKRIKALGHSVSYYTWPYWRSALSEHPDIVIGYSGGGSRATWLAQMAGEIKLMVLYDPSPASSMAYIRDNVKHTICYYNTSPMMLGLGGGRAVGAHNITTVPIAQQHLAVQYNQELHYKTLEAIKGLT